LGRDSRNIGWVRLAARHLAQQLELPEVARPHELSDADLVAVDQDRSVGVTSGGSAALLSDVRIMAG